MQSGDFSKLPIEFDNPGVERKTVLEQIKILRDVKNKNVIDPLPSTSSSWSTSLSELREERHKKFLESKSNQQSSSSPSSSPASTSLIKHKAKLTMLEKWESSCPYNYFLTKVAAIKPEKEGVFSASFSGT
jgi:hypothetical protein